MATIYKEISIDLEPLKVWEAVRDVGNVHTRFVPGYAAVTELIGDSRILTMSNGNIVKELIVGIDEQNLRLAYAVKESQMPLLHHHASFQVISEGIGKCKLIWITDFLPNELEPQIRPRIDRGAEVIKKTLENLRSNI